MEEGDGIISDGFVSDLYRDVTSPFALANAVRRLELLAIAPAAASPDEQDRRTRDAADAGHAVAFAETAATSYGYVDARRDIGLLMGRPRAASLQRLPAHENVVIRCIPNIDTVTLVLPRFCFLRNLTFAPVTLARYRLCLFA